MNLNPPHAIRPGTAFRDGKLYEFYRDGIIVLSRWPDMRAWRRTPKGRQWMQIRPHLRLRRFNEAWSCEVSRRESKVRPILEGGHIRDLLARGPDEEDPNPDLYPDPDEEIMVEQNFPDLPAFSGDFPFLEPAWVAALRTEYLKPIPEEVLAAVAPFSSRHWHLLNLIARCPGALDLVRATPALAFALASLWAFRQPAPRQPLRSARALLRKHQPEIAAWLGFPAERSTVRILRKLAPAECTIPNLLHLRDLFPSFPKALRHMQTLTSVPLHIMVRSNGQYTLSDTYLKELGASPAPAWLHGESGLLRDVLWLRETIGEPGIFAIHSHDHLQRIHDRLVERIGRMDLKLLITDPLPDPPFPTIHSGDLQLEPITEALDLVQEGRCQSNCVGAYAKRIRRGGLYVYRVLAPERATLSIVRTRNGTWRISELKAAQNQEAMSVTRENIESWLGKLTFR